MIKWASYHSINPLQQRRQSPSTITLLPPIADNLLPVIGDSISAPFDQIESNSNPPSSPPTADRISSVLGDNIPSDETISMYNPSQVSVSPTTNPKSFPPSSHFTTNPTKTSNTSPRSYADILRNSSSIPTKAPIFNDIPINYKSISHLSQYKTTLTKTRRTLSLSHSYADTLLTPPSPISTKALSTNDIPIIRGCSKNYSVLLSLDTDATKETFFSNLQPIIQNLFEQKASREDMLTSVTTFLKELALPTIGYSIKDQPKSFQSRYYATNPN